MLFTPHYIHGRELVDGGLLSPVPMAPTRQMVVDRVIAVDVNGPERWQPSLEFHSEENDDDLASAYGVDVDTDEEYEDDNRPSSFRERMTTMWKGVGKQRESAPAVKQQSMMELMSRSLDTMHAAMSRMQLAQDPPDMLIQIPRESCSFHEYWRAKEMIDIGHTIAMTALTRMPY